MINGSSQCVALLPMKANSQRVKGKNFRLLHGKPLFEWVLETLLNIKLVEKIVINTDASDLLNEHNITKNNRVLIRHRRPELIGDDVSMNLIIADDIAAVPADTYLMTHATNPMLSSETINSALSKYHQAVCAGYADSLFTVNKVQARFYRADATPINHDPNKLIQTQELEPWFEENSNLYIFSARSFAETNARIGSKPVLHTMTKLESVDIDTPEDWQLAEAIASLKGEKRFVASRTKISDMPSNT
jgi:CMP-N-acetylneuraminic acid synthetase